MPDKLCTFLPTERPHEYHCARCGLAVVSPYGPEKVFSRCVAADNMAAVDSQPAPLSCLDKAWSLAGALAALIADGLRTVDRQHYADRLRICDTCPERRGNTCLRCGCRLSIKARGRAFTCPLNKWPEQ